MTAKEVFDKMDRLKVTREGLGAYPHTLTNFKAGIFELTPGDAERISQTCDEIIQERVAGKEVVAA